ncbi:uncharacterized protein LOC131526113 isoform X2 [Onychostoma macrolepis]|uniref:uncharacterized protein LOC131526113 isoform X2 n=1 Tax=Onychostoma macrolepis TaxID=369639 RepID=UPI0027298433|nr:uncharacterized protein LOC131526113 isoform X2 [Onychostoma macrolepis]
MTDTMEKVIFFFCVFSYWIIPVTSIGVQGSFDLLRVQKGANISLNCSMRSRYEVAWYHLNSEEHILLISVKKDKTGNTLLTNYNQNITRLKIITDTLITTVSLNILGVTESDSGIYSCGAKKNTPEMFFDKPIRLEIEGLFVTEKPKEVDIAEVTTKERALMFGGVGLAIAVFFLATVIAGGIIHYRGWQKGWAAAKKRSSLIHHKSAK